MKMITRGASVRGEMRIKRHSRRVYSRDFGTEVDQPHHDFTSQATKNRDDFLREEAKKEKVLIPATKCYLVPCLSAYSDVFAI